MKAPVLGLIVATVACGASSLYLWHELGAERTRADDFAAKSAVLTARIAELEQARTQFADRRFANAGGFAGASTLPAGPGHPVEAGPTATSDEPSGLRWSTRPSPERSEAMQKMMRVQMRANNKRLYADVGSQLGLTKDQANKLIDMLTDQQASSFGQRRGAQDPDEARNLWEETQRQQKAELTDLIGADKVESLEEYQKTLPARQEVEMLARQLDGYDAPLSDDQRKRLVAVMSEERERVPMPAYTEGTDMEEYRKTRLAWEQDYNQRVSAQATGILNTQQSGVYTELAQAQQEMRAQFATMPPGARRMRGVAGGNMGYSAASGVYVDAVIVNAPPEAQKK